MSEQEPKDKEKEKAEKLAAAKKRVEQLKKKKKAAASASVSAAAGGAAGESKSKDGVGAAEKESQKDGVASVAVDAESGVLGSEAGGSVEAAQTRATTDAEREPEPEEGDTDADAALFADAIKNAHQDGFNLGADGADNDDTQQADSPLDEETTRSSPLQGHVVRKPSVSVQSKIRSASFRQGETVVSPGAGEDEEGRDGYRRQIARIEELERENRRLVEEARGREARRVKTESELEELRERVVEEREGKDKRSEEEVQRLRKEIQTLKQRKSSTSAAAAAGSKSPDADSAVAQLQQQLETREATISDLQLELSRLRSQLTGTANHDEQVTALQTALSRAENNLVKTQSELADTKKALGRVTEKAVVDSTSATSKETRIRELERTLQAVTVEKDEMSKKTEGLNAKIDALNKVYRETEARNTAKLAAAESLSKELQLVKTRLETKEAELLRQREKHAKSLDGTDHAPEDQELDELHHEATQKLHSQIRALEAENFDLRRGVWRDRREQLQPPLSERGDGPLDSKINNTDDRFDDVDLNPAATRTTSPPQQKHSGFTQVLNSGLAAFIGPTPTTTNPQSATTNRARTDSLLLQDADFDDFDETAFANAQREQEDAMKRQMVEHVREVKRGLKSWKGWRLDLVEGRSGWEGEGGFGVVFEV